MNYWIVICLDAGEYVLATRQLFANRADADDYANTCSQSRWPLVVEGRFAQLRLPGEK